MASWKCQGCGTVNIGAWSACATCGLLNPATARVAPAAPVTDPGKIAGKVKWFSSDKGFGFITDECNVDHYFGVTDVVGSDIPEAGDLVSFSASQGKRGRRATQITSLRKGEGSSSDQRVVCTGCERKMVPRMITSQGSLVKSVCPYCGTVFKDFSACFIASAVYGPEAEELLALRRFRDNVLCPSLLGRCFIRTYYAVSPSVASALKKSPAARARVLALLNLLVARLEQRE